MGKTVLYLLSVTSSVLYFSENLRNLATNLRALKVLYFLHILSANPKRPEYITAGIDCVKAFTKGFLSNLDYFQKVADWNVVSTQVNLDGVYDIPVTVNGMVNFRNIKFRRLLKQYLNAKLKKILILV